MRYVLDDILEAEVEALVNTVNTVGVMGKGIALQVKRAFPDNFKAYKHHCDSGSFKPGQVFVWRNPRLANPRFIFNAATKGHWRAKSRMEDVEAALVRIRQLIDEHSIKSIAVPPLGCGNGGLDWSEVKKRMHDAFGDVKGVDIQVFVPRSEPPRTTRVATQKPQLTPFRAFILAAMDSYRDPSHGMGRIEIQKLAYFLQRVGAPLQLKFEADRFGPYSDALIHAIDALEGHYIEGFGDRSGPSDVHVLPEAARQAKAMLRSQPGAREELARLVQVIEGFESPYGMELLASADWVMQQLGSRAADDDTVVQAVAEWNEGKRIRLKPPHVRIAAHKLRQVGLAPTGEVPT